MIKKWLQDIFEKKETYEFKEWRTDDSILKFLISNLDSNNCLKADIEDLPDEKRDENKIGFAPGLMDSLFGADDSDDSKKRIKELSKLMKNIAKSGDQFSEQEFYQIVSNNENVIGIIDQFMDTIVDEALPTEPYLFKFAKDLTIRTDNRNAVKLGIAILGLCQNKTVLDDIKILGLHDEFTVYSAISIINLSDDPVNDLWELAKKVDGWGKIQIVDRLAHPEVAEPIKSWLLTDGYKNNIMYEYLAMTCAVYGELHTKLEAEQIDYKLFKSTVDILGALVVEHSPSGDIYDYTEAANVIENFVRHAKQHLSDISDFNLLHKVKEFLTDLLNDADAQNNNGWNQDLISNCLIDIVEILNGRDWKPLVYDGLKSKNGMLYWEAKQAAELLGIDLWDTVWQKLQETPLDSTAWYDVTFYGKPEHADLIIDFAVKELPHDELGTGPKDSMGIGENYGKFMCLDYAITFLENHPGKGEKIILTGLRCPVTRNRNMAISVLDKWTKENWSAVIEKEVNHLKNIEPNNETRDNIKRLINGQELE
ncbi:hypothetical protein [Flavobacterium pedocola]